MAKSGSSSAGGEFLPKRPVQHVIEKLSRSYLEELLPDEWVIRDAAPDYGVDVAVEVFIDGRPVGRHVSAQLKGISKPTNRWVLSAPLKQSALNYLAGKVPQPAFLIFVDTQHRDPIFPSIAIARAREFNEIVVAALKGEATSNRPRELSIPTWRNTYFSEAYERWRYDTLRVVTCLAGFPVQEMPRGREGAPAPFSYFTTWGNEERFWRRETYASLGFIAATRTGRRKVERYLEGRFDVEDDAGRVGIMEAFFHLGVLPDRLVDVGLEWLKSGKLSDVLAAAHALGASSDSKVAPRLVEFWENELFRRDELLEERLSLSNAVIRAIGQSCERIKSPPTDCLDFLTGILCSFHGDTWENHTCGEALIGIAKRRPRTGEWMLRSIKSRIADAELASMDDLETVINYVLDKYCWDRRK